MRKNLLPALGCFLVLTLSTEQLFALAKGSSTILSPNLLPAKGGVQTTSLLSEGEVVGTYKMAGYRPLERVQG
ncbi:hypothetical protein V9K67_00535 [Paraflavisolibacter sp. H34]|uniref:hypothetical protein n=1 Tax=Huijunlia imazamoxiresistens TaxID=3127457 RepID=UPI003018131B